MKKLDFLYSKRREEIFDFYNKEGKVDVDNIDEVNDHIVDDYFTKENFDNPLEEFYITCAMCEYMTKNDLYDEYFFESFDELLEEYNEGKYDEYFLDINKDKADLKSDIDDICEYILKDKDKAAYYDALSSVYENEINDDK